MDTTRPYYGEVSNSRTVPASSLLNASGKRHDFMEFMTTSKSVNQSPNITSTFESNDGKELSPVLMTDRSRASQIANEYLLFNKSSIKMSTEEIWKAKVCPSVAQTIEQLDGTGRIKNGNHNTNTNNNNSGEEYNVQTTATTVPVMEGEMLFGPVVRPKSISFVKRKRSEQRSSAENRFVLLPSERRQMLNDEIAQQRIQKEVRSALSKKVRLEKQMENGYRTGILGGPNIEEPGGSSVYQKVHDRNQQLQDARDNVYGARKQYLAQKLDSTAAKIIHEPVGNESTTGGGGGGAGVLHQTQDKLFQSKRRNELSVEVGDSRQVWESWNVTTQSMYQNPNRLEHIVQCQNRDRKYNIISGEQIKVPYAVVAADQ